MFSLIGKHIYGEFEYIKTLDDIFSIELPWELLDCEIWGVEKFNDLSGYKIVNGHYLVSDEVLEIVEKYC